MRFLLPQLLLLLFPWRVRRLLLQALFGWEIDPKARIGFSIIICDRVSLGSDARIGHLNLIKGLSAFSMGEAAILGNLNWITAVRISDPDNFKEDKDRFPRLEMARHSAITNRHLIDCTDYVSIGEFSTVGGWRSQILTHSIDIKEGRQSAAPILIGNYCFIGTGVILTKGSALPSYSVLAAGSVLNKKMTAEYMLYSGVPAAPVKELARESGYFHRESGFVH